MYFGKYFTILTFTFCIDVSFSNSQPFNKIDSLRNVLREETDDSVITNTLIQLSREFEYKYELDSAIKYASQAELLSKSTARSNIYKILGNAYFEKGLIEKASQYYLFALYHLSDSRNLSIRESEVKAIREFQSKYHLEQQKLEIEILNKDKAIRNGIIIGVVLLLLLLFFLYRTIRLRKEIELNQRISVVENQSLRTQMNPHFIFNSLNSIDDYIQNNDNENSSLYLNKFSRLMRRILESTRLEEISLKDDLESLVLYIEIENLRMKNKVKYFIDPSPKINQEQILVPSMLLQPFVENAFKHAYSGIDNPKLEVKIFLQDKMLHFTITDNGTGRLTKQKSVTDSGTKNESLGLLLTQERVDIINKIKRSKAYIVFTDLIDSQNNAAGTMVELAVPVSYAF